MPRFAVALLFSATVALAQTSVPAPAEPDPFPGVPRAQTTVEVKSGKFGKPSAGDLIEVSVVPPEASVSDATPVEAAKISQGPVEHGKGRILWWKKGEAGALLLGLTTYSPGKYAIPPIPFERDGKVVFVSEPRTVEFFAVGGDKAKDDIYPPDRVGFPRWLTVLLAALVLALVLGALWAAARWNSRRKARIEELSRVPRVLTPLEEFRQLRSEVEKKNWVQARAFKPHYFALSDGAKRFLGRAYRFSAEERTSRELALELESLGMPAPLLQKWTALFDEMDVTKFTDQTPVTEAAQSLASRLSELVEHSYPQSPVARDALLLPTPVGPAISAGGKVAR